MSGLPGDDEQQKPPQWQQPQSQEPQSQPQWGDQQQQWQPSPQTPGSATAALILGICGIVLCPLICGPLAIVYGNKAKGEIRSSNGRLGGQGLAQAGVVMGWIGVAFAVLGILFFVIAIAGSS